jgi:hypothetical protein
MVEGFDSAGMQDGCFNCIGRIWLNRPISLIEMASSENRIQYLLFRRAASLIDNRPPLKSRLAVMSHTVFRITMLVLVYDLSVYVACSDHGDAEGSKSAEQLMLSFLTRYHRGRFSSTAPIGAMARAELIHLSVAAKVVSLGLPGVRYPDFHTKRTVSA